MHRNGIAVGAQLPAQLAAQHMPSYAQLWCPAPPYNPPGAAGAATAPLGALVARPCADRLPAITTTRKHPWRVLR
jgi:hypothetical protein